MKFKMKYFGSVVGIVSRTTKHFDKGQIIEAPEGEFNESEAEIISEEKIIKEVKEEKEISEGVKAETASFKNPGKKKK